MSVGKQIRLQRFFFPKTPKGLIVPIDHGLTMGPLSGIHSVEEMSTWITHPAITGVIAHKGIAERLGRDGLLYGKGLMIHLNGMSTMGSRPDNKVLLTSVQSALRLGADGVSIQVNFDGTNDEENLEMLGATVDTAHEVGLPLLAMIYDKVKADEAKSAERLDHLIRIGIELGCDALKLGIPANLERALQSAGKDIPIFIAGGARANESEILGLAKNILELGGAGLCVGRNVFERQDRNAVLNQLREVYGIN